MAVRLSKREGRFVWSATPEAGTQGLWDLKEQADAMIGTPNPRVTEFKMHILDNPYLSDKAKAELKAKILSPELLRIKWEGEFVYSATRVFPQWDATLLSVEPFEIPKDWNRIISIDPGVQTCAVLFAAVPPPDDKVHGRFIYLYDELYMHQCTTRMFASQMRHKTGGTIIREMIIDSSAKRLVDGDGKTMAQQYTDALKRENVCAVETGFDFHLGTMDRKAGNLAIHDWLSPRECGTIKLRLFRNAVPELDREMRRYKKKVKQGVLVDDPNMKEDHAVDALRYLRGRDPHWRRLDTSQPIITCAADQFAFFKKMHLMQHPQETNFVNLGPGAGVSYASSY